jgi:uncharacterized protein
MRAILIIMAAGAVTIGLFLALLYAWQSSLILLPGISGGSPDVLLKCGPGSAPWQEDGSYRGKICEPPVAAIGSVIIYHGNAGTVDDRASLALALTARGFRVVLVEYPGFGARTGKASINAVLAASLEDFERAHSKWPAPVYVLGESFGAGIAAEVVARHGDKAAGVVFITPWDSLANVVNAKFFLPVGFLLHQQFDIVAALSSYPGKVVIVAAGQDEVLPVSHARALRKAVASAAYLEIPGAGHNNWPAFMTRQHWDWVAASLVEPH